VAGLVGSRWFVPFTLAWLSLWTVQLTPLQLLIPLQLNTPGDADGWIRGVVQSGLVLGVGGLAGIVAGPAAGALSDRTRSRWGRRRPWALAGVAIGVGALVALAFARGPLAVGAAWVAVSVGFAVASSAFTALIADQLTTQRGAASAAVGSMQAVGVVLGVGVVVLTGVGLLGGYLLLAGLLAVGGTLGALLLPDPVPGPAEAPRARTHPAPGAAALPLSPVVADASAARGTTVLRDRDFVRLLLGRLAGNLGNALGTALLLFFLLFGIGQSPVDAQNSLLLLIVVYTVFLVAASVGGGLASDRTGRRQGMVVVAALVQGLAAAIIAVRPTLPVTLVAAALIGVGYGVFSAGGLALATDLLPDTARNAQDLGIVNVSANLGQLLGPVVGAGLIALVGGFWLLFVAAAAFSLLGAAVTATVRVPTSPPPGGSPA
jgi:MFS family permease